MARNNKFPNMMQYQKLYTGGVIKIRDDNYQPTFQSGTRFYFSLYPECDACVYITCRFGDGERKKISLSNRYFNAQEVIARPISDINQGLINLFKLSKREQELELAPRHKETIKIKEHVAAVFQMTPEKKRTQLNQRLVRQPLLVLMKLGENGGKKSECACKERPN
jgi:hypothetical protein